MPTDAIGTKDDNQSDATGELMRYADAARQLGITRQAVQEAVSSGRLPCTRIAGVPFVTREAVDRYAVARSAPRNRS